MKNTEKEIELSNGKKYTVLELLNVVYKQYRDLFKRDLIHSLHDLLWQVMINKIYKEQGKICFHVNVRPEGNEIVVAFESGGYRGTGLYFVSRNYNETCSYCDKINEWVFQLNKKEVMIMVSKSMQPLVAD